MTLHKFLITLINLITLNKIQAPNSKFVPLGLGHYLGQLEIRSIRSIRQPGVTDAS